MFVRCINKKSANQIFKIIFGARPQAACDAAQPGEIKHLRLRVNAFVHNSFHLMYMYNVRHFPNGIPKRQLLKCIFPSGNFPNVQFYQASTSQGCPKCSARPLVCSSRSARLPTHCRLRCLMKT